MTLVSHIETAGKFTVQQIPCHYYHEPVNLSVPSSGVLHTWEGTDWDGVVKEFKVKFAPHFIVGHKNGVAAIAQLIPVGWMGAALRGHNNMAIVQIEMAGFSKTTPWLPEPDLLDALCSLMVACNTTWGIPLSHPWPDDDWGKAGPNPHRSAGIFGKTAGWYGHQDMPFPDVHWDVGHMQWSKVFEKCKVMTTPPPATPVT